MPSFMLINFLWNLLPKEIQDKIKEITLDKSYEFLSTAFNDKTILENVFWKTLTDVVENIVMQPNQEFIKHKFKQALEHPVIRENIMIYSKSLGVDQTTLSFENDKIWNDLLDKTIEEVQKTEWRLSPQDATLFKSILLSQYTEFKRQFVNLLAENTTDSTKLLLSATLETNANLKKVSEVIHLIAQKMIGQIGNVIIEGNHNIVLVDVKGKQIAVSQNEFVREFDKRFDEVMYLLKDNPKKEYKQLEEKIRQELASKQSELDEYILYQKKHDVNQEADTSKAIVGKTLQDLNKKAVNYLFSTLPTKSHLQKKKVSPRADAITKLKALYLMSNGFIIKGTFLCLCPDNAIGRVCPTGDYISFGVYQGKDRVNVKVSDMFYGNLVEQFEQTEIAIKDALGSLQIVDLLNRIRDYRIPEFVIRELLANAVIHRDYSKDAKIHTTIDLYEDRLVIRNAGSFPSDVNPNDFVNIHPHTINKEIARIFFLHKIVELRGSGIQRVQTVLKERGIKPALFKQRDGIVSVTVYKQELQETIEAKAYTLKNNALQTYQNGDINQALLFYQEALPLFEALSQIDEVAVIYNGIALSYERLGDFTNALEYIIKAINIQEKSVTEINPNFLLQLEELIIILYKKNINDDKILNKLDNLTINHDDATQVFENLASGYHIQSIIYENLGEHTNALSSGLKSLLIKRMLLPSENLDLANMYNYIGTIYKNIGNYHSALIYDTISLKISESILPPMHTDLATAYDNIAMTYEKLGDYNRALTNELMCLAIREKVLAPNHSDLANTYNNLAVICKDIGNYIDALTYSLKYITIMENILPATHLQLAASYHSIALTYAYLSNWEMAVKYEKMVIDIRLNQQQKNIPLIKSAVNTMSNILSEAISAESLEKYAEVQQWFETTCAEYLKK